MMPGTDQPVATIPIKVRFTVGPVTIDTEAVPEQIVLLLKRTVEEFVSAKIIPEAQVVKAVAP